MPPKRRASVKAPRSKRAAAAPAVPTDDDSASILLNDDVLFHVLGFIRKHRSRGGSGEPLDMYKRRTVLRLRRVSRQFNRVVMALVSSQQRHIVMRGFCFDPALDEIDYTQEMLTAHCRFAPYVRSLCLNDRSPRHAADADNDDDTETFNLYPEHLTHLRQLRVDLNNTESGITSLCTLSHFTALHTLKFTGDDVHVRDADIVHCRLLTRLDLQSAHRFFGTALGAFPRLRHLTMHECAYFDVAHLQHLPLLERLDVGFTNTHDQKHSAHDDRLACAAHLTRLYMAQSHVLSSAMLMQCTALQKLNIWGCDHLCDASLLPLTNLRKLDMSQTRSTITGASLVHMPHLRKLAAAACRGLCNATVAALTQLHCLDISTNYQLSNSAVSTLVHLRNLSAINTSLFIDGSLACLTALERLQCYPAQIKHPIPVFPHLQRLQVGSRVYNTPKRIQSLRDELTLRAQQQAQPPPPQ